MMTIRMMQGRLRSQPTRHMFRFAKSVVHPASSPHDPRVQGRSIGCCVSSSVGEGIAPCDESPRRTGKAQHGAVSASRDLRQQSSSSSSSSSSIGHLYQPVREFSNGKKRPNMRTAMKRQKQPEDPDKSSTIQESNKTATRTKPTSPSTSWSPVKAPATQPLSSDFKTSSSAATKQLHLNDANFNAFTADQGSSQSTLRSQYMELHPPLDWQSPASKTWQQASTRRQQQMLLNPRTGKPLEKVDNDSAANLMVPEDISSAVMNLEDLYDPKIHLPYAPKSWKGYEEATPLSDYLMKRIGVTGRPLTTAEFMRQCLTHPDFGYYTSPNMTSTSTQGSSDGKSGVASDDGDDDLDWDNDDKNVASTGRSAIFGAAGDFVTAPEVSHVFGHCLCVWFVTQWQQLLRKAPKLQLVELGPGRGTLMMDILSLATSSKLADFGAAIHQVHFVEPSPQLRKEQEATLKQHLSHLIHFDFVKKQHEQDNNDGSDNIDSESPADHGKQFSIRVHWHDSFASFTHSQSQVDNSDLQSAGPSPTMIVAQELFDALPVHAFEYTKDGWRERLVDVVDMDDNPPAKDSDSTLVPRLRQVVAPDATPAADILLKNYRTDDIETGTVVEICPEGLFLVQDMQRYLEDAGGVALIVDYGQAGTGDTLRAFSNHKQVSLTSYPGQVDVTADVDFFALKQTVNARAGLVNSRQVQPEGVSTDGDGAGDDDDDDDDNSRVYAFGPVPQGEFLMRMGASDMVITKIEDEGTTVEDANAISQALKFLVLPEHMGTRFKVLSLAPKRDGIFAPAGMEESQNKK